MPTTIRVIHPRASNSARDLAESLNDVNGFRVRKTNLNITPSPSIQEDILINWGSSSTSANLRIHHSPRVFNRTTSVRLASNKLSTLQRWQDEGLSHVPFTQSRDVAITWLQRDNDVRVYCRTLLNGSSGDGIVVARNIGEVVQAPLYTKGVDTRYEFRLHVMDGVVFDGVRKAFRPEVPTEERNRDVMNHSNGTMFVRSGTAYERAKTNTQLHQLAIDAVSTLGLHFGAVDIIEDREGNFYLLEVNTACGLEGVTTTNYVNAFTNLINNQPITPWNTPSETLQEGNTMLLSQARVGQSVSCTVTTLSSLTFGRNYLIEAVGNTVIRVRNDSGRVCGYNPNYFTPNVTQGTEGGRVPTAVAMDVETTSTSAPRTPTPLVVPITHLDTTLPQNSPSRVLSLPDGSLTNPGGSAVFTHMPDNVGRDFPLIVGTRYAILEMRVGSQSNIAFVCVHARGQDSDPGWFRLSYFDEGILADGSSVVPTNTTPSPSTAPEEPPVSSGNNRPIRVGSFVRINNSAGGHGLPINTLGTVTQFGETRSHILITPDGSTRTTVVHPLRLDVMTPTERNEYLSSLEVLRNQQTINFTIEGHSYRIPSSDLSELTTLLRRFTV